MEEGTAAQAANPAPAVCANCGTPLVGQYCHACGQRRSDDHLSIGALTGDAVSHLSDFAELKTIRTLGTLLAKPGRLTNDYIAGRRVRWIAPIKLYLLIFAVTFFLYSAFESVAVYDLGTLITVDRSGMMAKAVNQLAARKHIAADVFVSEVNARWHTYASFSQIIYPLLFAIVLKLFYLRRRFAEHLIFSLHYQAVAFLIVVLAWPLYYVTGIALTQRSGVLAAIVTSILVGYLLLAVRAVYRQSWAVSAVKGVVLYGAYYFIYVTVTFGTLLAAMSVTISEHRG